VPEGSDLQEWQLVVLRAPVQESKAATPRGLQLRRGDRILAVGDAVSVPEMLAELHAMTRGGQKVDLKVELCISKDAETIAKQAVPIEPRADGLEPGIRIASVGGLPAAPPTDSLANLAFPESLQEPWSADLVELSKALEKATSKERLAQISWALEGSQPFLSCLQHSVCGLSVGEALELLRGKIKLPWFLLTKRPSMKKDLVSMVAGDEDDAPAGGPRLWAGLVRGSTTTLLERQEAIFLAALLCVGAAAVLWEMEALTMLSSGWSLGPVQAGWSRTLQQLRETYSWTQQQAKLLEAKLGTEDHKRSLPFRPVEIDSSAMLTPAVRAAVKDLNSLKSYEKTWFTSDKARMLSRTAIAEVRGRSNMKEASLARPLSFETWRSQGPGTKVLEALRVKDPPIGLPATPRLSRKPLKALRCVV